MDISEIISDYEYMIKERARLHKRKYKRIMRAVMYIAVTVMMFVLTFIFIMSCANHIPSAIIMSVLMAGITDFIILVIRQGCM